MNTGLDKAIGLLKIVNSTKINSRPVYELFSLNGYSLWGFFQNHIWEYILSGPPSTANGVKDNTWRQNFRVFVLRISAITISLLSFFIILIRRPRVFIFTGDIVIGNFKNDPRIEQVYKYLNARKISYAELVHTRLSSSFVKNFFKRRRPVIYLEAIDHLMSLARIFGYRSYFSEINEQDIEQNDAPEDFKDNLKIIIWTCSQRSERLVFKIKVLSKILSWLGPKALVMIDDMRYYHEVIVASRDAKIETISLQHARFNKYIPEWTYYGIPPSLCAVPDKCIVWNDFWKNRLIALSPVFAHFRDRIIVGGRPHAERRGMTIARQTQDDVLTMLIPHEVRGDREAILNYIRSFLFCPNTRIFYLLRRDLSSSKQLREIPREIMGNTDRFKVVYELTPEITSEADLVAGTQSTLLYEMITIEKPVAIMRNTGMTQASDLIESGMAGYLDLNAPDICHQLNHLASVSREELVRRRKILEVKVPIFETFDSIFSPLIRK